MPLFSDNNESAKFRKQLIEYFCHKKNEKIANLLKNSTFSYPFFIQEDNWHGSYTVYNFCIDVPLEMYVQVENHADAIANEIHQIANKLIRGDDRVQTVHIQIGDSSTSLLVNQESLEIIDKIKILLTLRATGKNIDPDQEDEYKSNRITLLKDTSLAPHVPSFVRLCSDLNEFWSFIQPKFRSYAERKAFIKDEIDKLINIVDQNKSPLQIHSLPTLEKLNSDSVCSMWLKSMTRLANDPEGAITAAKTLLEDVIKNLLNDLAIDYRDDKDDLPKLYSLVAETLNLSPAQHLDNTFKQILSGNFSIVNGMAGLRNKISDAHASGKRPVKPHKRHAEYVVNLAGSLSTFLVSTWEYNKSIHENVLTNTA